MKNIRRKYYLPTRPCVCVCVPVLYSATIYSTTSLDEHIIIYDINHVVVLFENRAICNV